MFVKLYFFVFYRHFLVFKKLDDDSARLRACMLINISFAGLLSIGYLILERFYFPNIFRNLRIFNLLILAGVLILIWRVYGKKEKAAEIYDEYTTNGKNTGLNRAICWIVFVVSFLAPLLIAGLEKGMKLS